MVILKDLWVRELWGPLGHLEDMGTLLGNRDAVWYPVRGDFGEWVSLSAEVLIIIALALSEMPPTAALFRWDVKLGYCITLVLARFGVGNTYYLSTPAPFSNSEKLSRMLTLQVRNMALGP